MRDAYAIVKDNMRRAQALGHKLNGRIPLVVVEHKGGGSTVAYIG